MTWPPSSDPEDIDELLAERETELSEERTLFARQRTLWAAEVTLNAWLRTALTCAVAGLAIFQFVATRSWVPPTIASLLTVTGAAVYVFALGRYITETRRLRAAGVLVTPTWLIVVIVTPMLLSGLLTLLLLLR